MEIAIKANPKRGKEIIFLLIRLGGINSKNWKGDGKIKTYYIDEYNKIEYGDAPIDYKVYTLEEFEKEFPFKVGDLCVYFSDILNEEIIVRILGMTIEGNCIMYEVGHRDTTNRHSYIYRKKDTLKPYKEMKEERNITLTLDKAKEWYKKGGELKEIALQAFTETELNPLPRSWEEYGMRYGSCCFSTRYTNIPLKYDALLKLEQLRDCWRQGNIPQGYKYKINKSKNEYEVMYGEIDAFLSFCKKQTAEEFLECFRDLIEQAGDLI